MKNLLTALMTLVLIAPLAFANPNAANIQLTYSGRTGNLQTIIKLNKPCPRGCNLQLRAAVHYEGLGTTGAVFGRAKSVQFRGNTRTFVFNARKLRPLRAYQAQDGKVTLQARITDSTTKVLATSKAIARFVKCGTGRGTATRQQWLSELMSKLRL